MARIEVRDLRKSFGDFTAVEASSFVVEDGEFFVMLGPSGCGKTTTLRMIAGLELPTSGTITLGGEDVTFRRASERDIAFVFQLFALYPHMNVRRNIAYPLASQGVPRREIRARVEETARLLRIDHLLDRSVSGLAGGDRQRVALGRAIVRRPDAFLMDEPLGTLDAEFRQLMCEELRALHDRIGATTVYVTHDQVEAMSMADQVAVMNHGVIEQLGPPQEIYDRPATLHVAGFIGSPPMNLVPLPGGVSNDGSAALDGRPLRLPAPRGARPDGPLILGFRPEHARPAEDGALRGEVWGTEYLGTTQIVTLTSAHGALKIRLPSTARAEVGEPLAFDIDGARASLFAERTGRAVRTALHDAPARGRRRDPALEAAHG